MRLKSTWTDFSMASPVVLCASIAYHGYENRSCCVNVQQKTQLTLGWLYVCGLTSHSVELIWLYMGVNYELSKCSTDKYYAW